MLGVLQDKTNITKVYNMEEYMWTKKQSQTHGGAVNIAGAAMCHVSVGAIWQSNGNVLPSLPQTAPTVKGRGAYTACYGTCRSYHGPPSLIALLCGLAVFNIIYFLPPIESLIPQK